MRKKFLLYKFGMDDMEKMMQVITSRIAQTDNIPLMMHPNGGVLIITFETSMLIARINEILKDAGVSAYMLIDPTPDTFAFNLPEELSDMLDLRMATKKTVERKTTEDPVYGKKSYSQMTDSELIEVRNNLIESEKYEELVAVREELTKRNINL